jgi:Flp pilus assembly protein TadG
VASLSAPIAVTPSRRSCRGDQGGSVLLLFPAAVLIVVVLAAIAVDSAIVFLGQREVANAVSAAANDATGEGVGNRTFYEGARIDLDPATVRQLALDRVAAALDGDRFAGLQVDVVVAPASSPGCPPVVRVRARASVSSLFAAALPGDGGQVWVTATATGSPHDGPEC